MCRYGLVVARQASDPGSSDYVSTVWVEIGILNGVPATLRLENERLSLTFANGEAAFDVARSEVRATFRAYH